MNEGGYIGLTLFSVFMASCSQVILKKSAMNDRLSGLSYFVNRATVTAYAIFWVQPAHVLLPFPFADGDGERVGVFRLRVYSFFDRFFSESR